jgi:deoxyadenosine/deoxycytidine kinase
VYIKPVAVHGVIGSGKTTVLTSIAQRGFRVLYEDLVSWRNMEGMNLLSEFYQNPSRLAYVFQSEVVRTRYVQFLGLVNDREWLEKLGPDTIELEHIRIKVVFTERDHMSSLEVFSKRLLDHGLMLPVEYKHITLWCKMLGMPSSKHIVYLNVTPDECMLRTTARSRPEEKTGVDVELLNDIDVYYRNWLKDEAPFVMYIESFKLDELEKFTKLVIKYAMR